MIRTIFTRKNLIAISIAIFYAITIVFTGACLDGGATLALMSKKNPVLMLAKNMGFRIPLKRGIYAELTLFYARGGWQKLPWTYRDYQSKKVQDFLTKVRKKYLEVRKEMLEGRPNKR